MSDATFLKYFQILPKISDKEIAAICAAHGLYVLNGQLASRMYRWGTLKKEVADAIAATYGYTGAEGLVIVLTRVNGAESLSSGGGHPWPTQYDTHCAQCSRKLNRKLREYPCGPWQAVHVPTDGERCTLCGRIYRRRKAYTKKGQRYMV